MRIGRIMIDTDNMTVEELTVIINDLRAIRKRKAEKESFENEMKLLILRAKENGFTFLDKDYGNVWQENDFEVFDERA